MNEKALRKSNSKKTMKKYQMLYRILETWINLQVQIESFKLIQNKNLIIHFDNRMLKIKIKHTKRQMDS